MASLLNMEGVRVEDLDTTMRGVEPDSGGSQLGSRIDNSHASTFERREGQGSRRQEGGQEGRGARVLEKQVKAGSGLARALCAPSSRAAGGSRSGPPSDAEGGEEEERLTEGGAGELESTQ